MNHQYAITIKYHNGNFAQAVADITQSLIDQGFGILTKVDVRQTLKKKLGVDYPNYMILGACNPPNAYKTLQLEKEIGLLLPCNVIVYEDQREIYISSIKPTAALVSSGNSEITKIAQQVEEKLVKALKKLENQ